MGINRERISELKLTMIGQSGTASNEVGGEGPGGLEGKGVNIKGDEAAKS